MIPLLVFSVWTFTSFSKEPAVELDSEEDVNLPLEPNTESPKMKPWNGSEENSMELSIIDKFTYLKLTNYNFIYIMNQTALNIKKEN